MNIVYFISCGVALIISKSSAEPLDVFDKFYQNDYKMKAERLEVVSYNKNIMKRYQIVTFKYNRTCAVANITMQFNVDVEKNLELVIQMYKFMSNEYRYFPVRLQVSYCFAIKKNLVGLGNFNKCGNFSRCPPPKGSVVHICNWTVDEAKFPPLMPEGRYMFEVQMIHGSTEASVVRGYGEVYRPFV